MPTSTHVAGLVDPAGPDAARWPSAVAAEAQARGVRVQHVDAGTPEAIAAALATIPTSGTDALLIQESGMLSVHRQRIVAYARSHRLPTVCGGRQ